MSGDPRIEQVRCARHPGRSAYDNCPRCTRPRCVADADSYAAAGCTVCEQTRPSRGSSLDYLVALRRDRAATVVILGVAAAFALAGTALGFHLVPGGRQSVFSPLDVVVAPYLCSLVGVATWPILFGTGPRRLRDS